MAHQIAKTAIILVQFIAIVLLNSDCPAQTETNANVANESEKWRTISSFLAEADELLKSGEADKAILMIRSADMESIAQKQLKTGSSFYLAVDYGPSTESNSFPGLAKEVAATVIHQTIPLGGGQATRNFEKVGCGCMYPVGKDGELEAAKVRFAHRLNLVMFHLCDEDKTEVGMRKLDSCRKIVDMTEQQWSSISLVSKLKIRELIDRK